METTNYNASPVSPALTVTTSKATLTGTLSITGTAKYGQTLTVNTAALSTDVESYTDFGTLSYKWMRGNSGGFTIIEGEISASYKLTAADIGLEIKAQVYPDNCDGAATSDPTGTIAKADAPTGVNQTYEVVKNLAQDYSFDLTILLPNVSPLSLGAVTYAPEITTSTDGVLSALSYTSGNELTLPVNSVTSGSTATVTVTVSGVNFEDFTAAITVNVVDKISVTISGMTMAGGTYNGSPFAYTGTPIIKKNADPNAISGITPDALYESTDGAGYSSTAAPTNAGAYKLTLSVPADNATYTGSTVVGFTITPKALTIKADDKSAKAHDSEPTYTYTVTGLVGNDTLQVAPTLTCTPDMTKPGTYPITISGASAGANYTISYQSGKLTVNDAPPTVTNDTIANTDEFDYDKDITAVQNVTKIRTPLTTVNITKGKKLTLPIELDDGIITVAKNVGKTFKSSNTKVVTVDSKTGTIKGIKPGKAKITVIAANGKSLTIKVNVVKKAVKLKKFTLTGVKKNALSLKAGKTKDLKIKLTQSKASDLKVTFKSSKKGVAKVDAAGRITAVKKGKATITVKVGSKTVKVKVTVK
jgi:hypothetical protein